MQIVAPAPTASLRPVRAIQPKKQPLFTLVRCVLINRRGRIIATGHMKVEDFARRNALLARHGLTCRWRELPAPVKQTLA